MLIASVIFVSCDKDDSKTDSIEGTMWKYSAEEDPTVTLTFQKTTFLWTMTHPDDGSTLGEPSSGTYAYTPPTVTLTFTDEDTEASGYEIAVDGKELTRTEGEEKRIFIKQ